MLRLWCLRALLCLSIWAIGSRAVACTPITPDAPNDITNCALGAPSGDDGSNRHWDAPVRTAAYLTASIWTSQGHHAELASARCLESRLLLSGTHDPVRSTRPDIRPHVRRPLLI